MSLRSELLAFDFAATPAAQFSRELIAFDRLSRREYDVDGRMHVESCNISKACVNPYYGREIPNYIALGLDPNRVYQLYRHPDELAKAAKSFCNLQLLDLHTAVHAADPKMDRTCGTIGSDVRFESPYLKASMCVWTEAGIKAICSRTQAQLSSSYRYRADMTPGASPDGVAYDGVMRDIVANHVALVREGRAGPDVCVSDSLPLELEQMKFLRPNLLALVGSVVALNESQRIALDSKLEQAAKDEKDMDACDERESAMDEREEAMDAREDAYDAASPDADEVKGDRKKARDSRKAARDSRKTARDARAVDRKAADADEPAAAKDSGGALDAALKSGAVISAADAKKLAQDAANDAVSRVTATSQAKRDVEPLVGQITVAMDSAEQVYRFALDQVKADHKGVHASALSALVQAEIRARKGAPRQLATDAAAGVYTVDSIFGAQRTA